jgi:AmiR/NasT family two-component response regulator
VEGKGARHAAAEAIRAAALALREEMPDLRLSVKAIDAILDAYDTAEHAELEALRAEVAQLKEALLSRATIEQAKGILMAHGHCSPERAFEVLVEASQHRNVKLREIARELVERTASGQHRAN